MRADLIFDFTNLTDTIVGEHGVSDENLSSLHTKAHSIHADMKKRRETGELHFRDLPYLPADDIILYADQARKRFDFFVNVGIGGSSLGAQALMTALCHPFHNLLGQRESNGLKMFFADNIDPDYISGMFDVINPSRTLFNIITKSGSTAETMSTFLLIKSLLDKTVGNKWRDHIVITTDPEKGDLRKIAEQEKISSFEVPEGVGGRFSVFSSVGLLPAACAGIDIVNFLEGAAEMDNRLEASEVMENPAYLLAMYHYLLDTEKGKSISVMMPYSSGLYGLADWFRQLWAESLGKRYDLDGNEVHVGQTPVKALGVTDQHSQVQLYVEGPFDKMFTILAVKNFKNELPLEPAYKGMSSLDYLGGHSMAELMEAERPESM